MNKSIDDLKAPFDEKDIEWRAGKTNAEKTKAMAFAYITSRAVMNRLDAAVGAENWQDDYKPGADGGVLCGISIRCGEQWVTKWDGADNSEFEAVKGGLSDAFKRAAVKWGIGRYLYDVPSQWVGCEQKGKSIVLTTNPKLPSWALPNNAEQNTVQEPKAKPEPGKVYAERPTPTMSLEFAEKEKASDGTLYINMDNEKLTHMVNAMLKAIKGADADKQEEYNRKIMAARTIIESRK